MAYSSIPDAWREVGKAVKKDLIDQIHTNLEDLNGRVTNVEGSAATILIANETIKKGRDHAPLGTMVWSPLSSAQFVAEVADGGWALADGSSATGTDYNAVIGRASLPDARGKFLRMRAYGTGFTVNPGGDLATDSYQLDALVGHNHTMTHGHSHTIAASGSFASATHVHDISHAHQAFFTNSTSVRGRPTVAAAATVINTSDSNVLGVTTVQAGTGASVLGIVSSGSFYTTGALDTPSGGTGASAASGAPSATAVVNNSGSVTNFTGSTQNTGNDVEIRPRNLTENLFIKINRNYVTARNGYLLWRAPQALTINQVILTPVTQGTSGNLTIDCKRGVFGSITTSIFTSVPSLAYNAAGPVAGTLDPTNAQLAAGEYLRVDITGTQAKLQEFHILIAAIPA